MSSPTPESPTPRRIYVQTWGCQMNTIDTGKILALLAQDGFEPTSEIESAQAILLNTCSVREKAELKVLSFLGRIASIKRRRPVVLALAGCFAQHDGARLFAEHPELDLVFGPDAIPRVRELFREAERRRVLDRRFHEIADYPFVQDLVPDQGEITALVTIQKGCDNHCTYCVVPAARGPEVSRPSEQILDEARSLVQRGARDLTLIGQNVDSYGRKRPGEMSFPELLRAVAATPDLLRLRFMTSHPRDLCQELIDCWRELPNLGSHLHLPVQSGSSRVLKRMNRAYSRERYLELVAALRQARPEISLTTDFIVGFPGETEQDFQESLSLLEEVRFDASFSFWYSPRPRTPALTLQARDPVSQEIARRRLEELQVVQNRISRENQATFVGREVKVLVEGASRQDPTMLAGRTSCFRTVNFPAGTARPGQVARVLVEESFVNSLRGRLLEG